MNVARCCVLMTLCACVDESVKIAPGTNAVRCECACGVGPFTASRTVEVCIDRQVEPSAEDFTADDLTALCDDACLGGVQAQAQESLVAENVVDDACSVSCDRTAPPEGLRLDACMEQATGERIECAPERCPVDLPGDPALVRFYLLRCTQVVDDSRADPEACGPDRPTKPLCVVDVGMGDDEDVTGGDDLAGAVRASEAAPSCAAAGTASLASLAALATLLRRRRAVRSGDRPGPSTHARRRRPSLPGAS